MHSIIGNVAVFLGHKELTNSLLLASDWLTISVCVIWFDKEISIEKSDNMTSKIPLLLKILELTLFPLSGSNFGTHCRFPYICGMGFTLNQIKPRV